MRHSSIWPGRSTLSPSCTLFVTVRPVILARSVAITNISRSCKKVGSLSAYHSTNTCIFLLVVLTYAYMRKDVHVYKHAECPILLSDLFINISHNSRSGKESWTPLISSQIGDWHWAENPTRSLGTKPAFNSSQLYWSEKQTRQKKRKGWPLHAYPQAWARGIFFPISRWVFSSGPITNRKCLNQTSYWNCNFPMTVSVRRSVGGRVCHSNTTSYHLSPFLI